MNEEKKACYSGQQKIYIALILIMVFPCVFRLLQFMIAFPIGLLVAPALEKGSHNVRLWLGISIETFAVLLALAGAVQVCRMIWPKKEIPPAAPPQDGV